MNIQDKVGKGFGSRERSYFMGVNDYVGSIRMNRPHATPNYEPGKHKFEADYYRKTYCSPQKIARIRKKWKNQVNK